MMRDLISNIKQSIVFLGYIEGGRDRVIGTGFLIRVKNVFHLVTAKHIVEKNFENLFIFLNSQQMNAPIAKPLSRIYKDGLYWISHPNPTVDISILPFPLEKYDKVKFIPDEIILNDFEEINELIDVFYLSYQPGLNSFKEDGCVNPIIRKGTISRINNNYTFFIDGFAFPGNSGSPVFTLPSPIKFEDKGVVVKGGVDIKLIGVVGSYVYFRDVAISEQTKKPKMIFEENTGLSLIWSTKFLQEIIQSTDFKKQIEAIRKKLPAKTEEQA